MNIHDFYKEELSKKKTISSKKAFLTKSHKAVSEHLKDLNDHKVRGWLLGERVTHIRIFKVKTELKVIENLKKALEKTGLKGIRNNTGKTPAEAQKRVALKLELKKLRIQRKETTNLTTKQLEALLKKSKKGLKGLPSGMTKSIAKSIKVTGLRKEDGTLQKGYKYVKGGKIVKAKTKNKNTKTAK